MLYVATPQTSSQTESACNATFQCTKVQHNATPTQHETHVVRQKC